VHASLDPHKLEITFRHKTHKTFPQIHQTSTKKNHLGLRRKNSKQIENITKVSPVPVQFIEGIPDINDILDSRGTDEPMLLILDDLMTSASNSEYVSNLFTRTSHHRNISVIIILQNMFQQGKSMRNISLNAKYSVFFKNPRDKGQILHLARQIHPQNTKFIVDAYEISTKRPHGYFFIDFDQSTPDDRRFLTGIFPPEIPIAFIPKPKNK